MNNITRGVNRILTKQLPKNSYWLSAQSKHQLITKTHFSPVKPFSIASAQRQFSISNTSKTDPKGAAISDADGSHQLYIPSPDLKKKMVFRGGKLLVFKMEQFDARHLATLRVVMAFNAFTLYSFAASVAKFRIIRSCFWGALSAYLSNTAYQSNSMFARTIKMIHLYDDGAHVEITFLDDSTAKAQIRQISRLSDGVQADSEDSQFVHSQERVRAFRQHQDRFGEKADAYMPILIGDQGYALDLDCSVPQKEILNAITRGLPIKTDLMDQNMINENNEMEQEISKQMWVDITNIQRKQGI